MSTRFYYGQQDYITQLNLMDDAFQAGPYSALPLAGGTMIGAIISSAGTVALPAVAIGANNSGLYRPAANQIGISINGVNVSTWTSSGLTLTTALSIANGGTGATTAAAGLTALGGIATTTKDASGGVPGLTLFSINMRNALNTITSFLANTATAARTWAFPDKSGTVALTSDVVGTNRIINGCMRVDQRNAGALSTVGTNLFAYTLDRWFCANGRTNGTTATVQQDTTDSPSGLAYTLKYTNTTAGASAAGDVIGIVQNIEGYNIADLDWGKATAKSITLSFWAKTSVTGNYAVSFRNSANNRAYVAHYTLTASTWTFITITVPGDTTGTWATNNTSGILLAWDLGMGSTYNTATLGSWVSANAIGSTTSVKLNTTAGAVFKLAGVQLETGSISTPLEQRSFNHELSLCQRYYCKTFPYGTAPANNTLTTGALFYGGNGTSAYHTVRWEYPVTMRATPTYTFYNTGVGTAGTWRDVANSADSTPGIIANGDKSLHVALASASVYTAAVGSAWYIQVAASAEL